MPGSSLLMEKERSSSAYLTERSGRDMMEVGERHRDGKIVMLIR